MREAAVRRKPPRQRFLPQARSIRLRKSCEYRSRRTRSACRSSRCAAARLDTVCRRGLRRVCVTLDSRTEYGRAAMAASQKTIAFRTAFSRPLARSSTPAGIGARPNRTHPIPCSYPWLEQAPEQPLLHLYHGLLAVSPGPVGVDFRRKIGFDDRIQHQQRCCHADPIPHAPQQLIRCLSYQSQVLTSLESKRRVDAARQRGFGDV